MIQFILPESQKHGNIPWLEGQLMRLEVSDCCFSRRTICMRMYSILRLASLNMDWASCNIFLSRAPPLLYVSIIFSVPCFTCLSRRWPVCAHLHATFYIKLLHYQLTWLADNELITDNNLAYVKPAVIQDKQHYASSVYTWFRAVSATFQAEKRTKLGRPMCYRGHYMLGLPWCRNR